MTPRLMESHVRRAGRDVSVRRDGDGCRVRLRCHDQAMCRAVTRTDLGWTNARGLTQEFGTVPGLLVARALVRENAAWHHGDEAEQRAAARDVQDAFCVPSAVRVAGVGRGARRRWLGRRSRVGG